MRIIFCADPLHNSRPDSNYIDEVSAAQSASFDVELIALERLVDDNDPHAAVRRITPARSLELGVYRGWMLRSEQYAALYEALLQRGIQLITSPDAYRICHELPAGYDFIRSHTPQTVWLPVPDCFDLDQVMAALTVFGEAPVILKDYVKSRTHEWFEACFIPSAADRSAVKRVVERFVAGQGENLVGGLVFRVFVHFQPIGEYIPRQLPQIREEHTIWLDALPIATAAHWLGGEHAPVQAPRLLFETLARRIPSRFFTMDVAQRTDGTWSVVELGDGQVAGLLPGMDRVQFYDTLYRQLHRVTR